MTKRWSPNADPLPYDDKSETVSSNPAYAERGLQYVADKHRMADADGRRFGSLDMTNPRTPDRLSPMSGRGTSRRATASDTPAKRWQGSMRTGLSGIPTRAASDPGSKGTSRSSPAPCLRNVWTNLNPINSRVGERLVTTLDALDERSNQRLAAGASARVAGSRAEHAGRVCVRVEHGV
jgi:hypothetical protein